MRPSSHVLSGTVLFLVLGLQAPPSADRPSGAGSPAARRAELDVATEQRVNDQYGRLPLSFEKNVGQTDPRVEFLSRGPGRALFLSPGGEAMLALDGTTGGAGSRDDARPTGVALRLTLVGAREDAAAEGREPLPGTVNYLRGNDRTQWRTGIPTYARVAYDDIYPGVDLVYYGNQRQLEYDFIVRPGADPRVITLEAEGADTLEVDARGDLVLQVGSRQVRQQKPVIYQDVHGIRHEREGRYVLQDSGRVTFQIGAYDPRVALVIDPVLVYSTYLGGALSTGAANAGTAVAVDAAGRAYVIGDTDASDFPTTVGAFDPIYHGFTDVFVTKLDSSGALAYSTFLGGNDEDHARGVAVDDVGNAYVTGHTFSRDFPATAGAYDTTWNGQSDAFVAKLDAAGAPAYSTFLGGDFLDFGAAVAVDEAGQAYVTGRTESVGFPTTAGAFDTSWTSGAGDVFVTKVDAAGATLAYSTFLGGPSNESGTGVAVDGGGHAYVTGEVGEPERGFPTTAGAYDTSPNGFTDVFVTKFDAAGATLVYSTLLGGTVHDLARSVVIDGVGQAYVMGDTTSANFPTTAGAYDRIVSNDEVFITKLNAAGSALVYSTFLGGAGGDLAAGIALDVSGRAHVTGYTDSVDFPTTPGAHDTSFNGGRDTFVATLNPVGSTLTHSTFLGGRGDDQGAGVAVDGAGNAYVTGQTTSRDFPTTAGAHDVTFSGLQDGFVTKLNAAGSAPLAYSTYLGGILRSGGDDYGIAVAVDGAGSAYVTGQTYSNDFPLTVGAHDTSFNGRADLFVTKLDAAGGALAYSTFLGGSGTEVGYAIAVDGAGEAYVTGQTASPDFPTTTGAYDTSYNGLGDVFVAKLNAAGTSLAYSTFLGSGGVETGRDIAVDGAGQAYVMGDTSVSAFPTTAGAYDTSPNGSIDVFVTKLASSGETLIYSTYLGGTSTESGRSVAVDGVGQAYVTGTTDSSDFPATDGAFDTSPNGNIDAFVTKLDAAGAALAYSTFLGGRSDDFGRGVAVDEAGHAYLTGITYSSDFPVTLDAHDPSFNGNGDAFVTKLDAVGAALAYSTFLGGNSGEIGESVAVDGHGQAWVTGQTDSSDFPTTAGAFDTSWNYSKDAFVTRLDAAGATLAYSTFLGGSRNDYGLSVAVDAAGSAYVTGYTYSYTNFPVTPGALDTSHNGFLDAFVTRFDEVGPPTAKVSITANGTHGPLTLSGGPLRIVVSFDAGSAGIVDPAEVYIGVYSPGGRLWFDPASHTFLSRVTPVYAGPLASFEPVTLVDLPNVSVLRPGGYGWFILVDSHMNGVPDDGAYFDQVVTNVSPTTAAQSGR